MNSAKNGVPLSMNPIAESTSTHLQLAARTGVEPVHRVGKFAGGIDLIVAAGEKQQP
jgi:hypothetical protein